MKGKGKRPFDPKEFLAKVNGGRTISEYRKDQIVYRQGDPADCVFFIQSGKVKKTIVSERGKEAVVAVLGTGDFFGERCLTGNALRLATVSALAKCVIARISKADITRVIHEEPTFAELFISHLFPVSTLNIVSLPSRQKQISKRRRPNRSSVSVTSGSQSGSAGSTYSLPRGASCCSPSIACSSMNGVPAAQACGTLALRFCTGKLVASCCNPP
jgi:CRP-like cAMP-binding protein